MAQVKILITGATGYLGSRFLLDILQSGYKAHIVVRSESKAQTLQQAPAIVALDKASACRYFIVPDLAAPGAMDEAAAGTEFVIHCATPLPFGEQLNEITATTVDCTLGALESARRAGTVKRVIILSSLGAFASPELIGGNFEPPEEIFLGDTPNAYFGPPYVNPLVAYSAAKTAALRRSTEWMGEAAREGVNFDLINLAPAYVFGRHPLAESVADLVRTSNGVLLEPIAGVSRTKGTQPAKTLSAGILLDDVVKAVHGSLDLAHVKTPDSGPAKGVLTYVMAVKFPWNDAYPIVARKWPEEVKRGLLAGEGDWPSKENVNFAMEQFHDTFGFKLQGLEPMLDDLVPQYLELLKKGKSEAKATSLNK